MRQWFVINNVVTAEAGKTAAIDIMEQIGEDWWTGDGVTAKGFIDAVRAMGDVAQIDLTVSSPGGAYFEALAINNFLKAHPARVTARVLGSAASAAAVIVAAADEIVMPANAMLFIHDPSSGAWGNAEAMRKCAADLDKIGASMLATFLAKAGDKCTPDDMRAMLTAETWLTAEEALACGLCDRIDEPMQAAASAEDNRAAMMAVLAAAGKQLEARAEKPETPVALAATVPAVEASARPDPVAVVTACREAGCEWLAPEAIVAGLSLDVVQARIGRIRTGKDIAAAAKIEVTQPLLTALAAQDTDDILRHAIDCARVDGQEITSQHRGQPATEPGAKSPNHSDVYSQLRRESAAHLNARR